LRKLMHSHGVHHAAVITSDCIKILQTHPVFRAVLAFQLKGSDRQVVAKRIMTRPAQGSQLPNGFYRLNSGGQAFIDTITAHTGKADHRLTGNPTVALKVARHAANRIIRVVPDIDMTVTVKVHSVSPETAR